VSSARKIRVVIVDDSMFMRAAIEKILVAHGDIEVVGQARNGREAVDKVIALRPDVVTMDFNMPEQNGAQAVSEIMAKQPTPIIMFSAHTQQGARETFEALAAGAVDFCTKPAGEVSVDLSGIADDLVAKVIAASGATPRAQKPVILAPAERNFRPTWPPGGPKVIIIGVSTGGPAALSRVIPALPAMTRSPIIIVQHMPAQFTKALAERLNGQSALKVREARDGDIPRPGQVLVAPGDRHLEMAPGGTLRLTDGPPVHGCRPSADVTLTSAARVLGPAAVAVIMTGMGRDGARGVLAIKKGMGRVYAQDEATSVIFGMPKAAIETGAVDEVVALDEIPKRLARI